MLCAKHMPLEQVEQIIEALIVFDPTESVE
jgi:hypothetical protein